MASHFVIFGDKIEERRRNTMVLNEMNKGRRWKRTPSDDKPSLKTTLHFQNTSESPPIILIRCAIIFNTAEKSESLQRVTDFFRIPLWWVRGLELRLAPPSLSSCAWCLLCRPFPWDPCPVAPLVPRSPFPNHSSWVPGRWPGPPSPECPWGEKEHSRD